MAAAHDGPACVLMAEPVPDGHPIARLDLVQGKGGAGGRPKRFHGALRANEVVLVSDLHRGQRAICTAESTQKWHAILAVHVKNPATVSTGRNGPARTLMTEAVPDGHPIACLDLIQGEGCAGGRALAAMPEQQATDVVVRRHSHEFTLLRIREPEGLTLQLGATG